ncbi:ATP-binding protein [Parabacteroides distasonis]|nr:ATP-binding protein [Parabacteroides distasonis]
MDSIERILRDQREELFSTDFSQFVPRQEEGEIDLDSRLAQIVIGVRRCGKSTLCQKVLLQSNVHFAYVNFDDETLASLQASQLNEVLEMLYRIYGSFTHLFMDEIQNVPSWHLFVNRLLRQGLHLVLTGSNANLLSGELSTHLTGRYNEIRLFPFSFAEYCQAKGVDTKALTTKASGLLLHALDTYLMQGGFPETLTMLRQDKYISSLYAAVISKDICQRYKVRYKKTLQQMANTLLDHFCQEVSFKRLQTDYQLSSVHTVMNYVSYLESACLLRLVPKYSFKSIERQTQRKSYAIDNAFVNDHDDALQTDSLGWRLENVIAIELLRRMKYETQQLFYLRQNKSYEVDFCVVDRNHVTSLIQVTYDFSNPKTKLYNREIGGLLKGAVATGCSNLTLIMMSGETGDLAIEGKTIHRVLASDWLLSRR